MTQRADRIFHGQCVKVRVGTDPNLGQTITYVTFVPQSTVKGAMRGRLTIRLLGNQGPTAHPGESTEGLPTFEEGEEVVLFLYQDSAPGLTSPVGFGQGKFKVVREGKKQALAVNAFGNERLLEGISPKAQARLGPRAERWRGRGAIPADELLEMARSLQQ